MNQKLVQLYTEGLMKGYVTYTKDDMQLDRDCPSSYYTRMLDVEYEAYGDDFHILGSKTTRKLPEFKEAVKIYKSPLAKALE